MTQILLVMLTQMVTMEVALIPRLLKIGNGTIIDTFSTTQTFLGRLEPDIVVVRSFINIWLHRLCLCALRYILKSCLFFGEMMNLERFKLRRYVKELFVAFLTVSRMFLPTLKTL